MVAVVFVLGDVGRSPRMQYHSNSISEFHKVKLVGYAGEKCIPQVESNRNIEQITFEPVQLPKLPFVILAVVKVVVQMVQLFMVLYRIQNVDSILVQNPPSIPTLMIVKAVCTFKRARFIIDWHNFGYTVLALRVGSQHPFVKVGFLFY